MICVSSACMTGGYLRGKGKRLESNSLFFIFIFLALCNHLRRGLFLPSLSPASLYYISMYRCCLATYARWWTSGGGADPLQAARRLMRRIFYGSPLLGSPKREVCGHLYPPVQILCMYTDRWMPLETAKLRAVTDTSVNAATFGAYSVVVVDQGGGGGPTGAGIAAAVAVVGILPTVLCIDDTCAQVSTTKQRSRGWGRGGRMDMSAHMRCHDMHDKFYLVVGELGERLAD